MFSVWDTKVLLYSIPTDTGRVGQKSDLNANYIAPAWPHNKAN